MTKKTAGIILLSIGFVLLLFTGRNVPRIGWYLSVMMNPDTTAGELGYAIGSVMPGFIAVITAIILIILGIRRLKDGNNQKEY